MSNDNDLPPSSVDRPAAAPDARASFSAPPGRFGRLAMFAAASSALALGVVGTLAYGVWFNHDQQAYAEAMAGARQALGMTSGGASVVLASTTRPMTPLSAGSENTRLTLTGGARPNTPSVGSAQPDSNFEVHASNKRPESTRATQTPLTQSALASNEAARQADAQGDAQADPEAGGKQASYIGQVKRSPAAPVAAATSVAEVRPNAVSQAPPVAPVQPSHRIAGSADAAKPSSSGARTGKEARLAAQDRRAQSANSRHQDSLFARVGSFFRRVSYRQHGSGNQQDLYSHP